jgi:hypothetical protein
MGRIFRRRRGECNQRPLSEHDVGCLDRLCRRASIVFVWEPEYAHGTPLDAASGLGTRQENVIGWLKEKGAVSAVADTR